MIKKLFFTILCLLIAVPVFAQKVDCTYFTADMPDDWTVVQGPSLEEDVLMVIFGRKDRSAAVFIMTGKNQGADAKATAMDLAEELNAAKEPVERDGRYFFPFTILDADSEAVVAVDGDLFMMTSFMGDVSAGMEFAGKYIVSEKYPGLIPK